MEAASLSGSAKAVCVHTIGSGHSFSDLRIALPPQAWSQSRRTVRCYAKAGENGFDRVQKLLGRVNGEEKRAGGFGPPPPANAERGPGFINLSAQKNLLEGSAVLDEQVREVSTSATELATTSKPLGSSPSSPPSADTNASEASATPGDIPSSEAKKVRKGFLLPTPFTAGQRVTTLGMVLVTGVAFGRSSQELLPEDLINFLQLWMRLAWGGHALLGLAAAAIASGKGEAPAKWFVKVLASGALGLQEIWAMPTKEIAKKEP
eukprot:TRINITY_DN13863_c0_g1_i1.p1 TRINITY_DN13863_c0_g1~~TRINITY_DN13863_c0_g1_i1.p1  ORF type:complete len:288 (-),score=35.02 TRINITY_DN13863_c0_g1_i1:284-1072(-)